MPKSGSNPPMSERPAPLFKKKKHLILRRRTWIHPGYFAQRSDVFPRFSASSQSCSVTSSQGGDRGGLRFPVGTSPLLTANKCHPQICFLPLFGADQPFFPEDWICFFPKRTDALTVFGGGGGINLCRKKEKCKWAAALYPHFWSLNTNKTLHLIWRTFVVGDAWILSHFFC